VPRGSSAPGEPIGSGFSALIFFGSFLYQDKKERLACSLPKFYSRLFVSKLFRPFRACKNRSLHTRGCAPCYLLRPFGAFVYTLSRLIVSKLFRPFGLVKIVRSIQGAAPLAIYSAPSGLKPPDKF